MRAKVHKEYCEEKGSEPIPGLEGARDSPWKDLPPLLQHAFMRVTLTEVYAVYAHRLATVNGPTPLWADMHDDEKAAFIPQD